LMRSSESITRPIPTVLITGKASVGRGAGPSGARQGVGAGDQAERVIGLRGMRRPDAPSSR
jgi:hypothetical protein